MRFPHRLAVLFAGLWTAAPVHAAETVDIGVLRNEDITVVQQLLYPKTKRSEIGVHLGYVGFDAYVKSPNIQLSYARHFDEQLAFSVLAGGGYGFKTAAYRELESPTYGVAPYAYRYVGSVLAGVEYAPIYAKLNLDGARVIHFDVYGALRGGLTVEQSVLPDGTLAFAPTVSPAVGARLYLGPSTAMHVAFRNDLLFENRPLTQSWEFKQNGNVTVGLTFFSARPERR